MKLMRDDREVRPESLGEAGRTVARYGKTAALFRTVTCESCDDRMAPRSDTL